MAQHDDNTEVADGGGDASSQVFSSMFSGGVSAGGLSAGGMAANFGGGFNAQGDGNYSAQYSNYNVLRVQGATNTAYNFGMLNPTVTGSYNPYITSDFLLHYAGNASMHECAKYVRQGLEAGGMKLNGHPTDAGDYEAFFTSKDVKGRFDTVMHGQGASPDAKYAGYTPQVGDIAVMNAPGEIGHIAVLCKNGEWVSDFKQDGASGMFGGHKFMTPDASFSVFRDKSLELPAAKNDAIASVDANAGAMKAGDQQATPSSSDIKVADAGASLKDDKDDKDKIDPSVSGKQGDTKQGGAPPVTQKVASIGWSPNLGLSGGPKPHNMT